MKRNFLMMAFVSLFTVVALCSCNKDDDEKKDEPKSAACEIVSFVVNDTVWNIDGENITHTYPPKTPKTSFTPAITLSPNAKVNPLATEAQNFFTAQGVTYTVTAEDGEATKTYTVKATVQNDDDDDENNAIQNNIIIAVVESGASFNGKIDSVKAEFYSESNDGSYDDVLITLASAPYKDGGFTLNLPVSVNSQYFESLGFDEGVPQGVTISNLETKRVVVNLLAYKSGSYIGYFYHGAGGWQGIPVYFDSNCNITGSYTNTYTTSTSKYSYNVSGEKGWNMSYIKETDKGNNSSEEETTTIVPAGAKWHFQSF
jgi:hypothetical protein